MKSLILNKQEASKKTVTSITVFFYFFETLDVSKNISKTKGHPWQKYTPHLIFLFNNHYLYIFPTKSSPGSNVSLPGVQLAGHTCPSCSATNFAA